MKSLIKTCIVLFLPAGLIFLTLFCKIKPDQIMLTTTEVSGVTQTRAFSGGVFSSGKESMVILKGVCWDTEENPTVDNNITRDGSGTEGFTSTLSGLTPGTAYYVRAFAVSRNDTVYGSQITFKTSDYGTVTDLEGNLYRTIIIGEQTWMAENLATTLFADGKPIPVIKDDAAWARSTEPACCWYKNDEASFKTDFGALYNWYSVNTGKLCPKDWHVPSDAEFTTLTEYLGGEIAAGGKMKIPGTTFWVDPNTGATNTSGFSAMPGGFRYFDGKFFDFGFSGYWWSSTQYIPSVAFFRFLYYNESTLFRFDNQVRNGFSVRCIKN